MFNSIKLTLYTQEDCYYCYELKKKLVQWGYDFREINISHDLFAKDFLKIIGNFSDINPYDLKMEIFQFQYQVALTFYPFILILICF